MQMKLFLYLQRQILLLHCSLPHLPLPFFTVFVPYSLPFVSKQDLFVWRTLAWVSLDTTAMALPLPVLSCSCQSKFLRILEWWGISDVYGSYLSYQELWHSSLYSEMQVYGFYNCLGSEIEIIYPQHWFLFYCIELWGYVRKIPELCPFLHQ